MHIIILGPGCPNCKKLEALTKEATAELGLADVTFQKVSDLMEIMKYPILRTPGLVINGKVVCSGRVPTKGEIKSWLNTASSN
nr:thioredoxin family protein [Chloroflexota bacterium]